MSILPTLAETLSAARESMRYAVPAHIIDADPVIYLVDGKRMTTDEFAPRFDELRRMGYGWLNFNIAGLHAGQLVIHIEKPFAPQPGWPRTSVNFSGPSDRVIANEGVVDLKTLS